MCANRRAMPKLCKFIERSGSEAEDLLKKKRKIGETSFAPIVVDYFPRRSQPSDATPDPTVEPIGDLPTSIALEATFANMPSSFHDLAEEPVCPSLSRKGTQNKTTVPKGRVSFVSVALQPKDPSSLKPSPVRVNASGSADEVRGSTPSGGTAGLSGASSGAVSSPSGRSTVPPLMGFSPLDPATLVAEFRHIWSDAMLGELGEAFHRYFGIVQVLNDCVKAEQ
ncbi:hypothetical protein L6164_017239 [Bauhinia variegata]|uniref:Uncharacterized protein n=1 Tax=Bauhinia variegata TaxID=167791 RepID=A0ACB9N7G3_BAUVA|nr:hypothetical protein L6164_017239 [Bauhinia variegata]